MSSAPCRYTCQLPGARSIWNRPALFARSVCRCPVPALTNSSLAFGLGLVSLRTTWPSTWEVGPTAIRSILTGGGGGELVGGAVDGFSCGCLYAPGIEP